MKEFFKQNALQQLQGWGNLVKVVTFTTGALLIIYTCIVTAINVPHDVAKLQVSMDSANSHITFIGEQLVTQAALAKENDKGSRERDARIATAQIAFYGGTPAGRKILEMLRIQELAQPKDAN